MTEKNHPEKATRDRLLETAARLFHEHGYNGTGVATILREAGVRSGSLYHFFPAKIDLLLGVLDQYVAFVVGEFDEAAFQDDEDPLERIFVLFDRFRHRLEKMRLAKGCPIGNLALEMSDAHPAIREKLGHLFDAWCTRVDRCLDEGRKRGSLPEGHEGLAAFIFAAFEGAVMQVRVRQSLQPFDDVVAHIRTHLRLLEGRDGVAPTA